MGHTLSSLGFPPDFDTDPAFIDTLMTDSPKIPNDAPQPHFTRDFFNLLFSRAKPHTAPSFDETSLYLFSICPPDIQTYITACVPSLSPTTFLFTGLRQRFFYFTKQATLIIL